MIDEKEKKDDFYAFVLLGRYMAGGFFLLSAWYFWNSTFNSPFKASVRAPWLGRPDENSHELWMGVTNIGVGLFCLLISWAAQREVHRRRGHHPPEQESSDGKDFRHV